MSLAEWTLFITSTIIIAFLGYHLFALVVDAIRGDEEARLMLGVFFGMLVLAAFIFSFMEVVFS